MTRQHGAYLSDSVASWFREKTRFLLKGSCPQAEFAERIGKAQKSLERFLRGDYGLSSAYADTILAGLNDLPVINLIPEKARILKRINREFGCGCNKERSRDISVRVVRALVDARILESARITEALDIARDSLCMLNECHEAEGRQVVPKKPVDFEVDEQIVDWIECESDYPSQTPLRLPR